MPTLAAESALAKDWLTPEEDAAWAGHISTAKVTEVVSCLVGILNQA